MLARWSISFVRVVGRVGGAKERRAVGSLRFPRRPRLPVTVCVGVDNSPHKFVRYRGNATGRKFLCWNFAQGQFWPGLPKLGFELGTSRSEGERINQFGHGCRYTPLSSSLVTGQHRWFGTIVPYRLFRNYCSLSIISELLSPVPWLLLNWLNLIYGWQVQVLIFQVLDCRSMSTVYNIDIYNHVDMNT